MQPANRSVGGGLPDRVGSERCPGVGAGLLVRPSVPPGCAWLSSGRAPAGEVEVSELVGRRSLNGWETPCPPARTDLAS